MNDSLMNANIPWVVLLASAFVAARVLIWLSGARVDWTRVSKVYRCEEGSAQSMSFVLTLPFFMMVLMLIVQVCQVMLANVAVHQAAYASVRSAAVWIPADVGDNETSNRISSFNLVEPTSDGMRYRVNSDITSRKYSKIKQAAVLAVAPMAPSRGFGYSLDAEGEQTAIALTRLYSGLDADSTSNSLIATRLRNKLAYSNANTVVQVDFVHRPGEWVHRLEPPLQVQYLVPPYPDEFYPNELGWQDHLTATVTFHVPLLPGPLRFMTSSRPNGEGTDNPGTSNDPMATDAAGNCQPRPAPDGFGYTDAASEAFIYSLSASATMVLEGRKPLRMYRQEEFE